MPETNFRHVRVRDPAMFSRFRVVTRMSHLDEEDQKIVRRKVHRNKRGHCKYTVGKLKEGRKIGGRAWKLQKIMVPKTRRKKR